MIVGDTWRSSNSPDAAFIRNPRGTPDRRFSGPCCSHAAGILQGKTLHLFRSFARNKWPQSGGRTGRPSVRRRAGHQTTASKISRRRDPKGELHLRPAFSEPLEASLGVWLSRNVTRIVLLQRSSDVNCMQIVHFNVLYQSPCKGRNRCQGGIGVSLHAARMAAPEPMKTGSNYVRAHRVCMEYAARCRNQPAISSGVTSCKAEANAA